MGLKNRNITGILGFDVAKVTASPNATVPVYSIAAIGSETDIDIAITPKGAGAITVHIADGTTAGGNKRGSNAVDWQRYRASADKVASGNSSVLSGGQSNKASGLNSAVGGGTTNTASGTSSTVAGGSTNTASGASSSIAGGANNTASTSYAFVGGGSTNTAGGSCAASLGGSNTNAGASVSVTLGGRQTRAYLPGQVAYGNIGNAAKARQGSILALSTATADATPAEAYLEGTTRAVLPVYSAFAFDVSVVARTGTSTQYAARFKRSGLIVRGASLDSVALEGAVQTVGTDIINTNLAGCAVAISADTGNGSLKVEVTGNAAYLIYWQVIIHLTELAI